MRLYPQPVIRGTASNTSANILRFIVDSSLSSVGTAAAGGGRPTIRYSLPAGFEPVSALKAVKMADQAINHRHVGCRRVERLRAAHRVFTASEPNRLLEGCRVELRDARHLGNELEVVALRRL